MLQVFLSYHFFDRTSQRNLSARDIAFVLQHGRVFYRTGIKFYFLGWRDIPEALRSDPHISRLEATTVLVCHDGTLITAYKDPQAIRKIKRKSKRSWSAPSMASGMSM